MSPRLNSIRLSLAARLRFVGTVMAAISTCALSGASDAPPLGAPGTEATYRLVSEGTLRSNCVERVTLNLGPIESVGARCQWLALRATKANGQRFAVWLLTDAFPA